MKTDNQSISSEQMYRIENNGFKLFGMHKSYMMENAGHGIADVIISKYGYNLSGRKIISFCGTGNNGGDAVVASRHLAGYQNVDITVIMLGNSEKIKTEEALINWNIIKKMKSIKILYDIDNYHELPKPDIIIDGIFGTGIKGSMSHPHSTAIDIINQSNAYVIAVDIPSGLNPDSGEVNEICVKADTTITFHRVKKGLDNKKEFTGYIHLEKIGIPIDAEEGVL